MEQGWRDRLVVVLVRARNPSNIGAVARAMHDFGFSRMRVVNEFRPPLEAAKSAVDAGEVMAQAQSCASVAEAVGDCTLVVGTTAVGERRLELELLTLKQAAPRIRTELGRQQGTERAPAGDVEAAIDRASDRSETAEAGRGRVAVLFGSEKTGLSNEELSHCNWLLTVPMHRREAGRHASMNLGQAAAVCLYELVREDPAQGDVAAAQVSPQPARSAAAPVVEAPARAAQMERITHLLGEVMERTGYARRYAHNAGPSQVRRLVRRIGMDELDAPVWTGILKQVLWKLEGGDDG